MSDRPIAFIYSHDLASLRYPADCPFNVSRATQTRERLISFGLLEGEGRSEVSPVPATRADLEVFHEPPYLDELERAGSGDLTVEGLHRGLGQADTPVFRDLFRYALGAAGASLTAADLILRKTAHIVFTPWGGFHHAMPGKASGFCYVNDVVLACERLTRAGKRVVFLDVDAHHGDGVQAAFYHRRDVLNISFHESGKTLFPWGGFANEIGEGEGRGFNVNVPLPAETYDEAYLHAFRKIVPPLLHAYRPDVIVLELGMDTLAGDPLTHLRLTNNAHVDMLTALMSFGIPMLVTGGGGYNVENTVRGWTLAWKTLCGDEDHDFSIGLGGVMLHSAEWAGGLRDHELPVSPSVRLAVEPEVTAVVNEIQSTVFPLHNI